MSEQNSDNPYRTSGSSLGRGDVAPEAILLASRWRRLFARLIDETIILVLTILSLVVLDNVAGTELLNVFAQPASEINPMIWFMDLSVLSLVSTGLGFLFYILLNFSLLEDGQTIGKRLMKIRMVLYPEFDPSGLVRLMFAREGLLTVGALLFGVFMVIDYLFIFGRDRRCLHDLWSGTSVVDVMSHNAFGATGTGEQ